MKSKLIFSWALFFDAFRSGGVLMMIQGVVFWLFGNSDLIAEWGRGSVLVGLLFWAGWALAKRLGVGKDGGAGSASF